MADQKREHRKIPVRKISPEELREELDAKIRKFERRYERSSEQALHLLTRGEIKETAEILEWMQAYHVRRCLKDKETRMAGIPTTITGQSTR